MKSPKKHFLPFLLLLLSTHFLNAAIIESAGPGRWDQSATWVGGLIPGSTDSVRIDGHEVVVNSISGSRTIAYLEMTNANSSNTNDSRLIIKDMIGGTPITLTVTGDFVANLEDENDDVEVFLSVGGSLVVNGDVTFTQFADHGHDKRLLLNIINNSVATFNGDFVYDYKTLSSSENLNEINMEDNAILNVVGATSFYQRGGNKFTLFMMGSAQVNLGDSLHMEMMGGTKMELDLTGNSSFTVNSNAHFENSGDSDYLEVELNNSAKLTVNGNLKLETNYRNIYIESRNTNIIDISGDFIMDAQEEQDIYFDLMESSRLELGGDLTRNGPNSYGNLWMSNTATLVLDGTITGQMFPEEKKPGSGMDEFHMTNIVLNNEAGFTLEDTLIVEDHLQFLKGNLITDSDKILILTETASISGASDEAFVDGPMIKLGSSAAAFEFPVGDGEVYAPIGISRVTNSDSEIKAEFLLSEPPPWGNLPSGVDNILEDQHWTLNRNSQSGELQVTLNWENASELGITNVDSLVVVSLDNTNDWGDYGNGAVTSSGETGSVTSSEPPPWGNIAYTIGSVSPINVLPVELLDFKAIPDTRSIRIEWKTETELNTDHFEIQRSVDGQNFRTIGFTNSQGESPGIKSYLSIDRSPNTGMNYYRLKIMDLDGSFEYSPVEGVKFEADAKLMIYPNPVRNTLSIQTKDFDRGTSTLEVFDRNGKQLYQGEVSLENGFVEIDTEQINVLNRGTYFLRVTQSSVSSVLKFIKIE